MAKKKTTTKKVASAIKAAGYRRARSYVSGTTYKWLPDELRAKSVCVHEKKGSPFALVSDMGNTHVVDKRTRQLLHTEKGPGCAGRALAYALKLTA